MPTAPAHLRAIRLPRSSRESYELIMEHGGLCKIGAYLDACSTNKLTSFRHDLAYSVGHQPPSLTSQNRIMLFKSFPASGQPFIREILQEKAKRLSAFSLSLTKPFSNMPSTWVSLDVKDQNLDAMQEELLRAFHDVPDITYGGQKRLKQWKGAKYRPRLPMLAGASKQAAELGLRLALAELHNVIVFCMRVELPRGLLRHPRDTEHETWEVIPFEKNTDTQSIDESGKGEREH